MSRLGDTIRTARMQAKMTEKTLARKCGMAEGVIKDIESGRRIVSDDQAQRILKILGVENPVSAELEVAQEPEAPLRPRPYKLPVSEPEAQAEGDNSAWLDALGGVVKRVPVTDENSTVIDHVLVPVVGGKIEGGAPDKVFYFRCPDDALRGYRIHAGDLLLCVPAQKVEDGAISLFLLDGKRAARKANKLDGNRVHLQSYDREFASQTLPAAQARVLARCVKLERRL
ncbi:MAG TPA: helix-turn-helix domain-containing protein [Candidatus Pullichristensenella avicola]|nr:helix-turn-helix domain-containing protein [Candidatus Pullichristensenella avicola]